MSRLADDSGNYSRLKVGGNDNRRLVCENNCWQIVGGYDSRLLVGENSFKINNIRISFRTNNKTTKILKKS